MPFEEFALSAPKMALCARIEMKLSVNIDVQVLIDVIWTILVGCADFNQIMKVNQIYIYR